MSEIEPLWCECGNPVRPFVTPIPEDTEVTWAEAVTGRALYCQTCFDAIGVPHD